MIQDLVLLLTVFMLAFAVGWETLGRVPPTLHLPVLTGMSAVSGVILAGAAILLQFGSDSLGATFSFLALFLASFQIVASLVLTNRLLRTSRKSVRK
jgi:H+-translocating NAD(P) transhydrogenase subunit alpha